MQVVEFVYCLFIFAAVVSTFKFFFTPKPLELEPTYNAEPKQLSEMVTKICDLIADHKSWIMKKDMNSFGKRYMEFTHPSGLTLIRFISARKVFFYDNQLNQKVEHHLSDEESKDLDQPLTDLANFFYKQEMEKIEQAKSRMIESISTKDDEQKKKEIKQKMNNEFLN